MRSYFSHSILLYVSLRMAYRRKIALGECCNQENHDKKRHRFNNTQNDDVIAEALPCFRESICGIGPRSTLHSCRKAHGQTSQ